MDHIYKEAIGALNSEKNKELKEWVENITMLMPSIAEMGKALEEESIVKGFSEQQSFDIAKEYMIRTLLPNARSN